MIIRKHSTNENPDNKKRPNNNPWEMIILDDYEKHMSLDSVQQLQKMNTVMKDQFEAYPVKTAMIPGVAGGNRILRDYKGCIENET